MAEFFEAVDGARVEYETYVAFHSFISHVLNSLLDNTSQSMMLLCKNGCVSSIMSIFFFFNISSL